MPGDVQGLHLHASGRLLQWRADGCWRELNEAQHMAEEAGEHRPSEDDWVRWTGTYSQVAAGGGRWDGFATAWLIYGELPTGAVPEVMLADGQRPPVLQLEGVWACEWVSVAQPATLLMGGKTYDFAFEEPRYRRHLR